VSGIDGHKKAVNEMLPYLDRIIEAMSEAALV
jgi:hypothetical protein